MTYVKKRFQAMENRRNKYESRWDEYNDRVDSPIAESVDGKAEVNLAIEQAMIEMKTGMVSSLLPIKVVPNGKTDIDILEPAKYVLDFFIERECVIKELRARDYDTDKYGQGWLYSGLWSEVKTVNEAV